MKTNWLWDTILNEKEVREILKNEKHPKFDTYTEMLLSRISDPEIVFSFINKKAFCRKWPKIKKGLASDRWLKNRILFWQIIYERIHAELEEQGIRLRVPTRIKPPVERVKIVQQIRSLRRRFGYTQKALAKKLGVMQQYISKIESGVENVSIDTLKKIANALHSNLIINLRLK